MHDLLESVQVECCSIKVLIVLFGELVTDRVHFLFDRFNLFQLVTDVNLQRLLRSFQVLRNFLQELLAHNPTFSIVIIVTIHYAFDMVTCRF